LAGNSAIGRLDSFSFRTLLTGLDVLRKRTASASSSNTHPVTERLTLAAGIFPRAPGKPFGYFTGVSDLLEDFGVKSGGSAISVIPHFNRQICESWTKVYPGRPLSPSSLTLADFRRDSGLSRSSLYIHRGYGKSADQARSMGHDDAHIFLDFGNDLATGFLFGRQFRSAGIAERNGFAPRLANGDCALRRHGSKVMYDINRALERGGLCRCN